MKRGLLAASAAIAIGAALGFATPASADGFSGFYAGIHGGYTWGGNTFDFAPGGSGFGSNDLFAPNTGATFSKAGDNGTFGGHAGYNYEDSSAFVYGIELSIDGPGPHAHVADVFAPTVPPSVSYKSQTNWFGSITPRIGYDADGWLLYLKGGLVYSEQEANLHSTATISTFCTATTNCTFKRTVDQLGWTMGGGVDYAYDRNWLFGVEYNYFDPSKTDIGGEVTPNTTWPVQFSLHPTYNTVLFRISYLLAE